MLLEVRRAWGKRRGQDRQALVRENLSVSALRQPKERSIRYTDMRSAMAEEGVVRLLFLDGALAEQCRDLPAEDFSSPLLARIYTQQLAAHGEGRTLTTAALAGELSPEEMGHLADILQEPAALANAGRAMGDYIRVIKDCALKRRGAGEIDPLLAARDQFKEKRGYGGKQHDK